MNVEELRKDFPMLSKQMHGKPLVYLDNAATTLKPQAVIDAIHHYYSDSYGTVHRAVYELASQATLAYQGVRHQVADFIHAAKPEEIIYTRGTTESINLVAYSFGKQFVKPGDEILISGMEHHSNIVPWQILCEDRGAILKVIPFDERGVLKLDEYRKLLNEKTKLVAVSHISNSLGTVNPVREMARMAHDAGAYILVDGAQAAPHMPIHVQELEADFYTFSGHKVYGPTGIGILYGKEALLEAMPPYQGGGDMIDQVTFAKSTYQVLPLKFEAGTPMIAEVIGLGAALAYLKKIGMQNILDREQELLHYGTAKLHEMPRLRIIGNAPDKGAIISFIIEGIHPLDIGTMLDLQGVAVRTGHHCAQPTMSRFDIHGTARASFGLYNTKEEIDFFVKTLHNIIKLF